MVTGAALATVNRLPVLLLPGDVFATRAPHPVLQQLELPWDGDTSVNDALRPVTKYWNRVNRPEQLAGALLEGTRVLTDQAETGAVCLALPQDVQAEAFDFPEELFERRVWHIGRPRPEQADVARAADLVRVAERPLIVSGGGTIYSEGTDALAAFVDDTGIPVGETQAGKGSLPFDHPQALGAVGATGNFAANRAAREADVVIGVGTRWSDFTTASHSAFQNPGVRFVNLNVAAFDAHKQSAVPLVADARAGLEELGAALSSYHVPPDYERWIGEQKAEWEAEVDRLYSLDHGPLPAQSEVIGAVNEAAEARDVVVCAAGSMPGDLHKLWRARDPKSYHVEYGYSCMGYEIPGGLGVRMAAPDREVFVMVGDGSYLMMPGEIVTAIEEGVKLILVLVDNHGYASIGSLSESVGSGGFGTQRVTQVDLATGAESLGAGVVRARTVEELREGLAGARAADSTVAVCIEVDPEESVPDFESWWDVPVAEVSRMETVNAAREEYEEGRRAQRAYVEPPP
jgi:3D-(3,5/4)-trihydroxycyclohexane-1,2-dione acylhydrolase (decyclizing)